MERFIQNNQDLGGLKGVIIQHQIPQQGVSVSENMSRKHYLMTERYLNGCVDGPHGLIVVLWTQGDERIFKVIILSSQHVILLLD